MMDNPFQIINQRLTTLEALSLDLLEIVLKIPQHEQRKYKVEEAANIQRCSKQTIRTRIKNGTYKAERYGRDFLIPHSELFNSKNEVKSLKYKRAV